MDDPAPERPPQPQEQDQKPAEDRSPAKRPPAKKPPAHWRDVAEEAIEEAMRSGAFDDLPGRGKPLNLVNNPYAPGTELAYQLLKDNQFTLPWISERASLLARIESLRAEIPHSWTTYQEEYRAAAGASQRLILSQQWLELLASWKESIAGLNKEIATLNLKQPSHQLEIVKLSLDTELARAGARTVLG